MYDEFLRVSLQTFVRLLCVFLKNVLNMNTQVYIQDSLNESRSYRVHLEKSIFVLNYQRHEATNTEPDLTRFSDSKWTLEDL